MADEQNQEQYSTDQLDTVQHPVLGELKFPHDMPPEERNQIIDEQLKSHKSSSGPDITNPEQMSAYAQSQAHQVPVQAMRKAHGAVSLMGHPAASQEQEESFDKATQNKPLYQYGRPVETPSGMEDVSHIAQSVPGVAGGLMMATPEAAAEPLTMLKVIAGSTAGGYGLRKGAEALHFSPSHVNAAGDAGSILGGLGGALIAGGPGFGGGKTAPNEAPAIPTGPLAGWRARELNPEAGVVRIGGGGSDSGSGETPSPSDTGKVLPIKPEEEPNPKVIPFKQPSPGVPRPGPEPILKPTPAPSEPFGGGGGGGKTPGTFIPPSKGFPANIVGKVPDYGLSILSRAVNRSMDVTPKDLIEGNPGRAIVENPGAWTYGGRDALIKDMLPRAKNDIDNLLNDPVVAPKADNKNLGIRIPTRQIIDTELQKARNEIASSTLTPAEQLSLNNELDALKTSLETKGPNEEYHKTAGKFYKNAVSDILPKYQGAEPLIGRIAKDVSEGGREPRTFVNQKEGYSPAVEAHAIKEALKDDLGKSTEWNPDVNQPKNLVDRARLRIAQELTNKLNENVPAYKELNQRYEDLKAASKVSARKMRQIAAGRANYQTPTGEQLFNVPGSESNWLSAVAGKIGDVARSPASTRIAAAPLRALRGAPFREPVTPEGYSQFNTPNAPTSIDQSAGVDSIIRKYGLDNITRNSRSRSEAASVAANELEARAQRLLENRMVNTTPVSTPVPGVSSTPETLLSPGLKETPPSVFRSPGSSVTSIREQATNMLRDAAELRRLGKEIPPNTAPPGPGLLRDPLSPNGGFTPEMEDRDVLSTLENGIQQGVDAGKKVREIFKKPKSDPEAGYISIGSNPRAFDHTLTPQQRAAELAKIPGDSLAEKRENWQKANFKNLSPKINQELINDYLHNRTVEELQKAKLPLTQENAMRIYPSIIKEMEQNAPKVLEKWYSRPETQQYIATHEASHWVVAHELGMDGSLSIIPEGVSSGRYKFDQVSVIKRMLQEAMGSGRKTSIGQVTASSTGLDENLFGMEGAYDEDQSGVRASDMEQTRSAVAPEDFEYALDSAKDILNSHQAGLDAVSHALKEKKTLSNKEATAIYEAAEAKAKQSGGIDLGPLPYLTIGAGAGLYGLKKLEQKSKPFKSPSNANVKH